MHISKGYHVIPQMFWKSIEVLVSPGVQLMRLGQGDGYWACTGHCNVKNWTPPYWWTIRQIYRVRPESCRSTVGSSPTPPSKSLINVGKNSYRPVLSGVSPFQRRTGNRLEDAYSMSFNKWLSVLQIWVGARIPNTVQYDSRQHTVRWYWKPSISPVSSAGGWQSAKLLGMVRLRHWAPQNVRRKRVCSSTTNQKPWTSPSRQTSCRWQTNG